MVIFSYMYRVAHPVCDNDNGDHRAVCTTEGVLSFVCGLVKLVSGGENTPEMNLATALLASVVVGGNE